MPHGQMLGCSTCQEERKLYSQEWRASPTIIIVLLGHVPGYVPGPMAGAFIYIILLYLAAILEGLQTIPILQMRRAKLEYSPSQ